MANIKKIKQEKNKIEIQVTVESDKTNEVFKDTYHQLSRKVKVPGFRTGRIPINILEMNLGMEYINHQVAEKLIEDSYTEALEKSELEPIDIPKVDIVQIEKGKPFIYKMNIEVKPEFTLPSLEKLSIEKKKPEVTEKEIEEELERIRDFHAKLNVVEDRKSEMGDFLMVDYEAFHKDNLLPDSKQENQLIQLGDRIIPEFKEKLVGVKPGEEKEIKVKIPENAEDKKIAGEEIVYKVKINALKEKELPKLDDDFAKSVGDYQKLTDLKEHIKKQLNEQKKYESEREFEDLLMDNVSEKCSFEVPEVLIEKQLENMMKNLEEDLKARNMSLADYYKIIKTNEEKVRSEYRLIAEGQVKKELIIDKVIQDDKITATEDDVDKKIAEIAESTNQKSLKVRAMFEKNRTLDNLKEQIKRGKAIAKLSQMVKIIEI